MSWRKDFPIFRERPELVYLDSAATSQKPKVVIDAVSDFYLRHNSNVHRGMYPIAQEATELYEGARAKIANFIGAQDASEIVFTGNATEALNLVARGWAKKNLKRGDWIVVSEAEHHSNFVPWLMLKEELGIKILWIGIDAAYQFDYKKILEAGIPVTKIKLVALTQASNVLGTINPVAEIVHWLKQKKIKARVVVDGAQSVPHIRVSVKEMGCDFLAFSAHKMVGPAGVGVLWARKELLEQMEPTTFGGHMISEVSKMGVSWGEIPERFEAGTGRLEQVVGLGAAVTYLQKIGMERIAKYEEELTSYALEKLTDFPGLELYGSKKSKARLGVLAFNLRGVHAHDVGEILGRENIAVRVGHHCAQPLLKCLGTAATVRASLYLYNTKEDINKLMKGMAEVRRIFKHE